MYKKKNNDNTKLTALIFIQMISILIQNPESHNGGMKELYADPVFACITGIVLEVFSQLLHEDVAY